MLLNAGVAWASRFCNLLNLFIRSLYIYRANTTCLCRYRSVLFPITKAICELLDPQQRESKCNELIYEDFEKMHPDDVARFCEWLTEKVDGYSSKIKLEAKDLEEEVSRSAITTSLFLSQNIAQISDILSIFWNVFIVTQPREVSRWIEIFFVVVICNFHQLIFLSAMHLKSRSSRELLWNCRSSC